MQQSNIIFGTLLIAFIIFITMRGELPQYLTLLRGGGTEATQSASNTAQGIASQLIDPGQIIDSSGLFANPVP